MKIDQAKQDEIIRRNRKNVAERQSGYRERALKLFPHICGGCGREFAGKRLKELTVHHKDHDHDNNPPDGGNWELLCIYCHDHEHDKIRHADHVGTNRDEKADKMKGLGNPFADLDKLL